MARPTPTANGGPSSASRTTYALLDGLPDALPLPGPLGMARRLVDQHARIEVHDDGVTLTGLWGKTVRWERMTRIELVSRLDDVLSLGVRLTPVGRLARLARIPKVPEIDDLGARLIVGAAERVAPDATRRVRDRLGWTVVRFVEGRHDTELRRLPSVVAHLYPAATEHVVSEATLRDIPVIRRDAR